MEQTDIFQKSHENINLPPADANINNQIINNQISAKKQVHSAMIINKQVAFQGESLKNGDNHVDHDDDVNVEVDQAADDDN